MGEGEGTVTLKFIYSAALEEILREAGFATERESDGLILALKIPDSGVASIPVPYTLLERLGLREEHVERLYSIVKTEAKKNGMDARLSKGKNGYTIHVFTTPADVLISVRLPLDVAAELNEVAARLKKPRSEIIREAVSMWLDAHAREPEEKAPEIGR